MGNFGIFSIIPSLLVIIIAIRIKRPIEALLIGCVSSYLIIALFTDQNFIELVMNSFFSVILNYDNVWMIFVCGLFGSLIVLLNASNGTIAIADLIKKVCKNATAVLLSAWTLGIAIFIDDYMNIMTISSCLKKLCDKLKIPRAMLAYVIDSTGAPTCVLIPFSTWAVFFASSFYEQEAVRNLGYGSAMETYIHAIPYMFYAVIAVIIVPLVIMGVMPLIGPMKEEYKKIEIRQIAQEETKTTEGKVIDFIIPIAMMISITIISGDMFLAILAAIVSCVVLYLPRKVLTIDEFCDLWIKGFADMIPTLAILLFAFFMKQACADINLPAFVVQVFEPYVTKYSFPAVTFIIVCLLAFITGDNWGVPAICVPIIIPLAVASGANLLVVMGAVVSGGVFCSHACFYSDATVLTSACCEIDNMVHAKTQIPYAVIAWGLSFILYIIAGLLV